MEQTVFRNVGI